VSALNYPYVCYIYATVSPPGWQTIRDSSMPEKKDGSLRCYIYTRLFYYIVLCIYTTLVSQNSWIKYFWYLYHCNKNQKKVAGSGYCCKLQ